MTPAQTKQAKAALHQANTVRSQRVNLRNQIAAGTETVANILADPPAFVATMQIRHLLLAQRQWGPARVTRLLAQHQIGQHRPIEQLTTRQRDLLANTIHTIHTTRSTR